MAFNIAGWQRGRRMGVVGTGQYSVKYEHTYVTADDAATIQAANYFNPLSGQLSNGDILHASLLIGGANVMKSYVVTSANGAATVTIALQTTV